MIPILNINDNLDRVLMRSQLNYDDINLAVKTIVNDVKEHGDEALFRLAEKFDKVKLDPSNILVTKKEIEDAYLAVDAKTLQALRNAKTNIYNFHIRQLRHDNIENNFGATTGFIFRPVNKVGVYIPGGKAPYPSSVLMCVIPAMVAGVKEVIMATPAGKFLNALTIVAANECGVKKIYKVGGAQAIAAMAFGTQSVPKVDVISGPGNIYVALAKREVYGNVGIDMIAGPSEITIIADSTAKPEFLAADMLSQAEHDELSMSLLITTDRKMADSVLVELKKQVELLPKSEIAKKALLNHGAIVICETIEQAIELSNKVAPEHLELAVDKAETYISLVENAGAVFLGHYSPEPLGDYYAGTNHVLPTSGTARFCSSLGVDSYIKKISVVHYDENSLKNASADIVQLASEEQFEAHANSIRVRFKSR